MTKYDDNFTNVHVIYKKDNIKATLGEVLEYQGKKTDPYRGNRKISSCDLFLFRRKGEAFQR